MENVPVISGQFIDNSSSEVASMALRLNSWLSEENSAKARGKTREQIFEEFGNAFEPIAYIHPEYLPYLDENLKDNRVYSGKGYFIDHVLNHHPEVPLSEYAKIQEVLTSPSGVYYDNRKTQKSLVFVKKYENFGTVIVGIDKMDGGKIVIHKSFFNQRKNSYAKLNDIRVKSSLVVGHATISPAINKNLIAAASALSGRNDAAKVVQNFENS